MMNPVVAASLLVLCAQGVLAVLYGGREANHSIERCICCMPTPECLTNVGPGSGTVGPTDKTHQHVLFESLQRELNDEPCTIEGKFPSWAAGSIFKNGFGQFESTKSNYNFLSVFDAMAYSSRITITKQGTVSVTAKLTKSDWFNRSEGLNGYSAHIPPYRSFMGTDPELSLWGKIRLLFTILPDNLNVNIVRQGKRLFGISDMDGFNEIDPDTMEYKDYFRYADTMSMTSSLWSILGVMTSAHPVFRPSSPHIMYNFVAVPGGFLMESAFLGNMFAYVTVVWIMQKMILRVSTGKVSEHFSRMASIMLVAVSIRWCFDAIDGKLDGVKVNKYIIYKLDTTKEPMRREEVVSFSNQRLSYVHEMAITGRYLVLAEWPTFWNIGSITNPLFNDPAKLVLTWDPNQGTRITVIDTERGTIASEHTSLGPYWSYHHINSFEDGNGNIVMDACTFDTGEHLHTFETRTLKKNTYHIPRNINRRFIIPVGKSEEPIMIANIGPIGFDLPIKNPEYTGRKYRYSYGTGHRSEGEWWNTLVKVDMESGKTLQWFEEHTWPSQPVFVPNPERKSEDQGLLLTLMFDGKTKRSFLLALDAASFVEIARAWLPIPLPYTSHGYFDVEYGGDRDSTVIPGVKNNFFLSESPI